MGYMQDSLFAAEDPHQGLFGGGSELVIATDGSAAGNPGPGGWAWYVHDGCWAAGGEARTTNNVMELTALREALRATEHLDVPVLVIADSRYVIDAMETWRISWKRRGWRKADGSEVANVELMRTLDTLLGGRRVRFEWTKAHRETGGHPMNEAADRLARAAAEAYRDGRPARTGPGWG